MIKEIKNFEEVHGFVKKLTSNELTTSYPRIRDDERLHHVLESSIKKDNYKLIASYDVKENLVGVSSYFWEDENQYMQTTTFLAEGNYDEVADEMINYFKKEFKGYDLYIGFPKENKEAVSYFSKKSNYECIEDSVATHINDFKDYKSKHRLDLVHIKRENFSDYAGFHDGFAKECDMYYDAKNLLSDIDEFGILGLKEKGKYVASIFFKPHKKISTAYGLFLDKKHESMDKEDIMIDGMLEYLSNKFDKIDEVIYFIDIVDQNKLKSALRMGF